MSRFNWDHYFRCGIYLRYSGVSKFRQNGTYKKKTKDNNKAEWRKRKGFAKDQGKQEAWCNCSGGLKQQGNRQHRRWAKKLIHTERFDDIYWHQDMFVSAWDAC